MLTVVPMTVCGREKRHSAPSRPACRPGHGDRDAVHSAAAQPRAQRERDPDRHEDRARERAEHEAPGEHEPPPQAHRRAQVLRRAGGRERRRPGGRLAAADGDRVAAAAVAVPVRRDRCELDVLEAGPHEPLAVLVLGREQHPQLREPRAGCGRRAAPARPRAPPRRAPARGRPPRSRARARASTRSSRPRRSGRSGRSAAAAPRRRRAPSRRRASAGLRSARRSWCGLWSSIVTQAASTRSTIPSVVKPVPAPASRVRSLRSSSRAASSAAARMAGGPEQRVDPPVVAGREEAVEPVRLLLVLDQPHAPPVTVPSR